ncbi:hypothetical protein V9T40_014791 [Parthenolecanium corni]|uniref:Uncharacterized protein n=1 Tax=Parthenolecanium corni TaxID=536013 RepID=A0AAN9T6E4_9HEMI
MADEELSDNDRKLIAFTRQFKCCSGVFIASAVTGMSWVLTNHDSSVYRRAINETIYKNASTWVAFGATLAACYCTHFIGRRKTIIGMQLLYVGPLLVHAASSDPVINYAGALTTKFGSDMLVGLLTLYTAEVSQAWTRAFFIGIYQLAFYTGVTVARFLPHSTQMTIFLSIMLDAAALGLSASAPETPHYLVMTDQPDEAEELMQALWFDAGDEEATALLDKAELYADEYREGVFPIVMSSQFAVPLAICFFLSMANYHICDLFFKPTRYAADAYGYPYMDLLFTVVFPGIPLKRLMTDLFHIAGCFIYLFLCFLIKRRTLFLFSVFTSLAYGFMALLAPLGPKVLILVYSCTMWERMGLRQLGYTLPAEIFPAVTRDIGVFVSYLIHYMVYNQKVYMTIQKPYGTKEIISIIVLVCFPIGVILTYLFMPETKDLPLTETEELGQHFIFQPLLDLNEEADEENIIVND